MKNLDEIIKRIEGKTPDFLNLIWCGKDYSLSELLKDLREIKEYYESQTFLNKVRRFFINIFKD